jgi:predicted Zn-dependent protease
MAQQVEAAEKVSPDDEWQTYLNEVGQRIAKVSDRTDIEYHFKVIESDMVNAFAAPGGYIYFYTGLLRHMETEAELAGVMAHEISHVVGRHGVKRMQTAMGVGMAWELLSGDEQSDVFQAAVMVGLNLAFAGYSREAEREADEFGMYYMVQAGYHPQGMIDMFNTLAELGGAGYSNVFEKLVASHPETQERISKAEFRMSRMRNLPPDLEVGRERYQRMLARLPAPEGE